MRKRKADDRPLREVLRRTAETYSGSNRELEERLHIGHGNIQKLVAGGMTMTAQHLLRFAEVFEVPVEDFLALAFAARSAAAKRRLAEVIGPAAKDGQRPAGKAAAAVVVGREELEEVVREVVRAELDRRAAGEPPAEG